MALFGDSHHWRRVLETSPLTLDFSAADVSVAALRSLPFPAQTWPSHGSLPWASPGATCLVSPGQAGTYKGRRGPGAVPGLAGRSLGIGLPLGTTKLRTPLEAQIFTPTKEANRRPHRDQTCGQGTHLRVSWEPRARGALFLPEPYPLRTSNFSSP